MEEAKDPKTRKIHDPGEGSTLHIITASVLYYIILPLFGRVQVFRNRSRRRGGFIVLRKMVEALTIVRVIVMPVTEKATVQENTEGRIAKCYCYFFVVVAAVPVLKPRIYTLINTS